MKFRILVRLVTKILGMRDPGDAPRADMYLPDSLLAFGLILIGIGGGLAIAFIFILEIWMILAAAIGIPLGILAIMCWKNQTITVISDEIFEYSTFLGKKYKYQFGDITSLRKNNDSLTLFLGNKKVHIESIALISDRLVDLINKALEKNKFPDGEKSRMLQNIFAHSEWIVKALNSSGYAVDYNVESMKEIDRFIDEQNIPGGLIDNNRTQIIFALASYIGQTVIKIYGGEWVTDDNDPEGELEISVKLPNGFLMWPVHKCIKRCQLGAEESIYSYVRSIKTLDK